METTSSFELQLQRLDEIVRTIETRTLPLEESIILFDEGTRIIKELENALSNAEAKITEIISKTQK